ncbi:regulator of G-protein signaling domain-containing protein [Arenibaculum pallidiluteum]|uniref:hypothetical protein n=1 Tax=Arenibaculum pallidiluteum TaxID=2812559 RepID=UPI001A96C774|nr:hypothetical protein [Arenibaculum pallidiluteum]
MSGSETWKRKKDEFTAATGKSKPKTKVFGIAVKSSGLDKAFKAVELMPTYQLKVKALHVLAAQAAAYMKTLKKEAEAVSKKSDPDYVAAVVALSKGLAEAVGDAKRDTQVHLFEQIKRLKTRKFSEFRKYCDQEFSTVNLDIMVALKKVKKQSDLKSLYEKYLEGEANLPKATLKLCQEALQDEAKLGKAVERIDAEIMANLSDTYSRFISTLKLPGVVSPL